MPTQPRPQPPAPETPRKPARPTADPRPPGPDATVPKPAEEGALFRALLDAGAGAVVAYTAEKRIHNMISEAVAPQLQPLVAEICRRFDEQFDKIERRFDRIERRFDKIERRFDKIERRLDEIEHRLEEHERRLDQHDRKLDALAAAGVERDRKLDVLIAQMRMLVGGLGVLVTVLIAVFGVLFTR